MNPRKLLPLLGLLAAFAWAQSGGLVDPARGPVPVVEAASANHAIPADQAL